MLELNAHDVYRKFLSPDDKKKIIRTCHDVEANTLVVLVKDFPVLEPEIKFKQWKELKKCGIEEMYITTSENQFQYLCKIL